MREQISNLRKVMEAHEIPETGAGMSAYLKHKFLCFGIKSPIRKQIQKNWFQEIKQENHNHWEVVYNLWDLEQREYHYIAIDYLNKVPKQQIRKDDDQLIEELITTHSWWDSVDSIASNYVGMYFQKFPGKKEEVITRWRKSDNLWLNRTSLIFQLKYKDDVDFNLLKDLIKQFQPNKEFFIQKAIGWSLRQYSKFNPDAVRDFVEEINLQGLALREAKKYL